MIRRVYRERVHFESTDGNKKSKHTNSDDDLGEEPMVELMECVIHDADKGETSRSDDEEKDKIDSPGDKNSGDDSPIDGLSNGTTKDVNDDNMLDNNRTTAESSDNSTDLTGPSIPPTESTQEKEFERKDQDASKTDCTIMIDDEDLVAPSILTSKDGSKQPSGEQIESDKRVIEVEREERCDKDTDVEDE